MTPIIPKSPGKFFRGNKSGRRAILYARGLQPRSLNSLEKKMSALKFNRIGLLVRIVSFALISALSACANLASRPAEQARDCDGVLEEPYMVCNASVG